MTRFKKPKINKEVFKVNPLVTASFSIPVIARTVEKSFTPDREGLNLPTKYLAEMDECVKVYTKSHNRKVIMKLQGCAIQMFFFFVYEIEAGKSYVWINKQRFMEEHRVRSMTTVRKALQDLEDSKIICSTDESGFYWFNPAFFYRGSRSKAFKAHLAEFLKSTEKRPLSPVKHPKNETGQNKERKSL